ncbi:TPA: hypothetical protein H1009_00510 [archaeon]|nr:hypothetical protein [Candidatus Naiadarchaeales archaeon SRR2090153.bin461]
MSRKDVVIDDFIGGEEGRETIKDLKWFGKLYKIYVPLELGVIQKAILKKLKKKKYELMIFVETGGVYFLCTPEMLEHTVRATTIPVSERKMEYWRHPGISPKYGSHKAFMLEVQRITKQWIEDNKDLLKANQKIAIVEGDVGRGDFSYIRLAYIRKKILEINPNAKVELIVGIITTKQAKRRLFDIVGVTAGSHTKLSDIAHNEIENNKQLNISPVDAMKRFYKHYELYQKYYQEILEILAKSNRSTKK